MATANKSSGGDRGLNDMLKDYMPYKLLSDEIIKRDYFLSTVEKDQKWKGGQLQVPFLGANASSLSLGSLTGSSDIADDDFIRGVVSNYAELWGTMQFHQRDLDSMSGGEGAFVDLIGDRIEVFAQTMKEALSAQLLSGAAIDKVLTGGTLADGVIKLARPELFQVGQKIVIDQGGTGKEFYVIAVDLVASKITVSDSRGETADVVAATEGTDLIYHPGSVDLLTGAVQNTFTSLPGQLLVKDQSSGNAVGSEKLFGQTKTKYPHLQAFNKDGGGLFLESNDVADKKALKCIFETQNTIRRLGRGNPSEAIMSYKNYGIVMSELENSRQYQAEVKNGNAYGWSEVQVSGVRGSLKIVAVPEMSDANILILDKSSMKLHSDGFVERRTAPDGKQFLESREPTGYKYIVDHRFYGDLVVNKPSNNGIVHSCDQTS